MKGKHRKIVFVYNTARYLYHFRLRLMQEMRARGWEVIAVSPVDRYAEKFKAQGIRFFGLPLKRKGKNPLTDLLMCLRLYRLYRREKPDIVHHFTVKPVIFGTLAARISGISQIINHIPGLGYTFLRAGFIQRLVEILYRLILTPRVQMIFQNPDDLSFFLNKRLVIEQQSHLIPGSGVNTDYFSPERFPDASPAREIIFVLVARMLWDKGIAEYVEAAKMVRMDRPETRFLLIGSPDKGNPASIPLSWLEKQQKDNRIEWIRQTEDVRPYLASATAVILPSYREGLPRSLTEGAAMAKPIITTAVPGCKEIVENGVNGYLVPPRDPESLAHRMLKLAGDPVLQKKMGRAGRERILEFFDERVIIQRTLEVLDRT
jgi:glycosyltransferase involved in cell wall biosynthesis